MFKHFALSSKKDKSIALSLPADGILHGIKIQKLPIGRYLKALNVVKNLPELLLKECFPGMKPDEVLTKMKQLNEDSLYEILGRLVQVVPEQFFRLISEIVDTDYETVIALSPKELFDVLNAFWQVNDMSDFFAQIKGLVVKMNPVKAMKIGSSG